MVASPIADFRQLLSFNHGIISSPLLPIRPPAILKASQFSPKHFENVCQSAIVIIEHNTSITKSSSYVFDFSMFALQKKHSINSSIIMFFSYL